MMDLLASIYGWGIPVSAVILIKLGRDVPEEVLGGLMVSLIWPPVLVVLLLMLVYAWWDERRYRVGVPEARIVVRKAE